MPTGAEHSALEESKSIENFKTQKDFLEEEFGGGTQKTAREANAVSPPGLQLWVNLFWLVTPPFFFSGVLDLDPYPLLLPPDWDGSSAATSQLN